MTEQAKKKDTVEPQGFDIASFRVMGSGRCILAFLVILLFVGGASATNITQVGSIDIGSGIRHGAIDTINGYGYFPLENTHTIVKIRLSDLVEISNISLDGFNQWYGAFAIDKTNGYLYKITRENSTSDYLNKIRLSDFTLLQSVHIAGGSLNTLSIDTQTNYLYAGTLDRPDNIARIYKINADNLQIEDTLLNYDFTGDGLWWGQYLVSAIDEDRKLLFLTTDNYPYPPSPPSIPSVYKVDLNTFTFAGNYTFDDWETSSMAIDTVDGYIYPVYNWDTVQDRPTLIKMKMSDLSIEGTIRNESFTSDDWVWVLTPYEIDNNFLYIVSETTLPGTIYKFRKNPFEFIESFRFNDGYYPEVVLTDNNGFLYVGTASGGVGNLIKLNSGETVSSFSPSGYVKDNLGNPISNADITFWRAGFSILTTSDSTGYYNLNGKIADGFYAFIAMKDGHGQAQGSGTITNGGSLNINFTLYSGDPCPGFVCGLVGRYNFTANSTFYTNPQVGFIAMSDVTVNLWNESYTASNSSLSWGYYQIPVSTDGDYSITANKSSYVTRGADIVTVTNNSALKYLFTTCQGDINLDENVNVNDFVLFGTMYNSNSTSNNYFNLADLNNDSYIDVDDFVTFAMRYNSQCTED